MTKSRLWTGRILMGFTIVFLLFVSVGELLKVPQVLAATLELGYPISIVFPLGVVLAICTILYAVPATSILGAILLTGYLGGAVATHVRAGNPWFSHILVPVYLGAMIWGGLYLKGFRIRRV
jgi:hypothetical protein